MSDEQKRDAYEHWRRTGELPPGLAEIDERDGSITGHHWEGWQARDAEVEELHQRLADLEGAFNRIASVAKPYADLPRKLMRKAKGEPNAE